MHIFGFMNRLLQLLAIIIFIPVFVAAIPLAFIYLTHALASLMVDKVIDAAS